MSEAFVTILAINVVAAVGMHLVYVTNQLNLGQAGFLAVGAYTTALADALGEWPLPLSLLAGAFGAAVVALPVALGASRLHGVYLIMGTLAVGEITRITIGNLDVVGGIQGFSGQSGIDSDRVLLVAALVLAGAVLLMASPAGLHMRSVFDDAAAAAAAGVAATRVKVYAVIASAAVVGTAGGLLGEWFLFITPRDFGVQVSFEVALYSLLGGVHSVLGAVVGAVGITALHDGLSNIGRLPLLGDSLGGLADSRLVIYGAIVGLIMVFRPEGLVTRRLGLRATAPLRWLRRRWLDRRWLGRGDAHPTDPQRPHTLTDREVALEVRNLSHSFGGVQALGGIDLTVHAGESIALIGANGAGKTTLVNVVSGSYRCQSGHIRLGGADLTGLPAHRRTRAGIARTFQSVRVFAHLTVEETLRLGHRAGIGREREPVHRILQALELTDQRDALPSELTLAQRRRLEIGRAIASAPAVVLLDEPSAGMNDEERRELAGLIRSLPQRGTAVVLIDHNLDFAFEIGERVIVLDFGEILMTGTRDEVMADRRVRDAYLGAEADDELAR